MFLIPCLVLGMIFAVVLGGRLSRLADVPLRHTWTVFAALGLQVVLFSSDASGLDEPMRGGIHIASYGILALFAVLNMRVWTLAPVLIGMLLNGIAITANGGKMPVWPAAARAVGLDPLPTSNVSTEADRLRFLGDVFALPTPLPLANVFSIGDVLIGFGMAAFVIYVSLSGEQERPLSPRRLLEPLRVGAYRRVAVAKLVSSIGDWLTLATLIGWMYGRTGATEHIAAILLVRLVPPIVGGGLAAYLVDRLPKRGMLVWVEGGRGIAVAGALVGVVLGEIPVIYGALAASAALASISSAAIPALIPSLLPNEQLPAANAGLGMSKDAAMALGALGAGIALSTSGAVAALAVDLGTFVVAMILYLGLRVPDRANAPAESRRGAPSGLVYIVKRRPLLVLVFSFATATLATGLTNVSLPRFLESEAGLGPGAYGFGIAALASGLLLGEAVAGFSRVGAAAGRWIGAGLIVMAGLFGVLGLVEHAATALLLLAFIGFVDGTTDVLFETVAQRESDPRYYGAVFGFASAFMATTMTTAFLLAPVANRLVDPKWIIFGAGAFLCVAGLIALVGMPRVTTELTPPAFAAEPTRVLRRGSDVSVITWPPLSAAAREAAGVLESELSVEVVAIESSNGHLDAHPILASVEKTSKVIVYHDDPNGGGRGAEIAALIAERAFEHLDAPVRRVTAGDNLAARLRELADY